MSIIWRTLYILEAITVVILWINIRMSKEEK